MTREEAIKNIELAVAEVEWEHSMYYSVAFEKAIEALKEPVRKHSEWLHGACSDTCKACKYSTGKHESGGNYCPNCGAKMDAKETKERDGEPDVP